jgi:hypothetical protein
MIMTQDKIIDRDQLQDSMINQILDDMDIKTMMAILYDNMSESYDKYSVDELIAEVEEYYPWVKCVPMLMTQMPTLIWHTIGCVRCSTLILLLITRLHGILFMKPGHLATIAMI